MIMREPANQWSEKGMFGMGVSRRLIPVKRLVDEGKPEDSQKVTTTKEKFVVYISNALLRHRIYRSDDTMSQNSVTGRQVPGNVSGSAAWTDTLACPTSSERW